MQPLPFKIPQSLNSYLEQFEESPDKVVKKLEKQVSKRGLDAVGHFLLSWFYHVNEKNEKAIQHALIAKTYAPGSPLMEHLHYYLIHPEKFEASVPASKPARVKKMLSGSMSAPILDLDKLIALLSEVEAERIKIPVDGEPFNDEDLAKDSSEIDDIASETIAQIHINQGKHKEAAEVYKKLIKQQPDKKKHFEEKIASLKESKA